MAQDSQSAGALQVNRLFEQPPDSVSFYCDLGQVFGTPHEVVMQFYETIPGPPGPSGQIQVVRSRLRATVMLSRDHAGNIANALLKHAAVSPVPTETSSAAGQTQP